MIVQKEGNRSVKRNILREYLESNSSEVKNMLLTEWNWKDAEEVWREEGREEGEKNNKEKTIKTVEEMLKNGVTNPEEILTP